MSTLTQAIEYAKLGEKVKARQLLAEIVQSEPNNELAWLWMSSVVEDTSQQIYCLEKVLKINPGNQNAAAGLSKLKGQTIQDSSGKDSGDVSRITNSKAQALPDISKWSNGFAGWSILAKVIETDKPDPKLGLLIAEAHTATKRIFGWAAFFIFLALLFAVVGLNNIPGLFIFVPIVLIFLGAAIYRIWTWYTNRDLQVRIFREGMTHRKNGKVKLILWSEVEYVKEEWQKMVYQGIIHIKRHKIEVVQTNGEKLELNRSFEKIEEIGRLIQLAVADHLLAATIDKLKNNATCDFGSFAINQSGITHKGKNFLPWNEVHGINILSVGQTIIQVQKVNNKKGTTWASQNGGTLKNLQLFLSLSYWFIYAAHNPEMAAKSDTNENGGDVLYKLPLTKAEARDGVQKTFYIGFPMQEKRLVVKVPAGVQAGTTYRFPDFGRPIHTGSASTGTLIVEVLIEKVTALQKRLEEFQIAGGAILLGFGMIWLGFWSTLGIIESLVLAGIIGGVGGGIMSIRRRFTGIVSGAIGGVVCVILQIFYYEFMYLKFGRDSFWNYESVLVLIVSALPGVGLYILLKKIFNKKASSL